MNKNISNWLWSYGFHTSVKWWQFSFNALHLSPSCFHTSFPSFFLLLYLSLSLPQSITLPPSFPRSLYLPFSQHSILHFALSPSDLFNSLSAFLSFFFLSLQLPSIYLLIFLSFLFLPFLLPCFLPNNWTIKLTCCCSATRKLRFYLHLHRCRSHLHNYCHQYSAQCDKEYTEYRMQNARKEKEKDKDDTFDHVVSFVFVL